MSKRELKDLYINAIQFNCNWVGRYERLLSAIYVNSHIPVKEEELALRLIHKHYLLQYESIKKNIDDRRVTKWKKSVKKRLCNGIIIQKDIDSIIFSFI